MAIAGNELKMSEERIDKICSFLRQGYSRKKSAICSGITRQSFSLWYSNNPAFKARVDEAEGEYLHWKFEEIKKDSLNSLKTLICGIEYDEKTEETREGKDGYKFTVTKITHKRVLPNPTAVIFALCNRDPEHWQNRVTGDIKGELKTANVNGNLSLDKVPDELLQKVIESMK